MFAGIYYWFPKLTGRKMSTLLGHIHFWPSFLFMNGIFFPMLIQGLAGVQRRLYDGGASYSHAQPVLHWNAFMSGSAWLLGLSQIAFILNLFWSMKKGEKAGSKPLGGDDPRVGRDDPRRRSPTATSWRSPPSTAVPTTTACRARRRISPPSTSSRRPEAMEIPYNVEGPSRYRPV